MVAERIAPPGEVITPLDEAATALAVDELRDAGINSICICFLFAFLNPEHEVRAGQIARERHPEADITLSHQVTAQYREFERFTTAAVNAFVKPKVRRYFEQLARGYREAGFVAPIRVMQSNGGVADIENAGERPVNVLLSGPAAGVIAAKHLGDTHGHRNLITLDIGGTSADISLIPGKLVESNPLQNLIGGYPVLAPKLDVSAIGAGGGSVAWVDPAGAFQVGPRSAGAVPGPACYGKGGTEATVTDAHVVLGRVDANSYLAGRMTLDTAASHTAVEAIGGKFGMSPPEAALAILRIVNANMVREIRVHSIRRGYDPRECTLVPFGGAGPLHACEVADELDVPRILVPPAPGVTSARGLLATDLRYDVVRTVSVLLQNAELPALETTFEDMERDTLSRFGTDTGPAPTLSRRADCRYAGQGYELPISFDGIDGDWQGKVAESFHAQHMAEYGFNFPATPIQIVNLRVTAVSAIEARPTTQVPRGGEDPASARTGSREILFSITDGPVTADTYDRALLVAGNRIDGPAVINEMDSTVVVTPDFSGEVLGDGTLLLTRKEA
ncbi:MAG: hydantoinase/oxoprolinase family protein [Candidatus Nanopelagicales bacterium]